jgi:PTH1 family peptidyl-tRNA hydrolase
MIDFQRTVIGMYVVVGLGNPGRKYEHTRHNVGFDVVDILSQNHHILLGKRLGKAVTGEGTIGGKRVALCLPQTYMNLSGESVVQLANWYKPELDQLIVCYDDVDLPEGKVRFRTSGSAGTRNGMRNIIYLLGRDDFPRVRVGIGRPPEFMDLKDYVLTGYNTKDERQAMFDAYMQAADVVAEYVKSGADGARRLISAGTKGE